MQHPDPASVPEARRISRPPPPAAARRRSETDPLDPDDRQRLDKSLRGWVRRLGTRTYAWFLNFAEDLPGRDAVVRILSFSDQRRNGRNLDMLIGACANGYERVLVEPLVMACNLAADTLSVRVAGIERGWREEGQGSPHICIEAQPRDCPYPYVPDFRIEWRTSIHTVRVAESGEVVECWIPIHQGLVIECDSMEYHGSRLQQSRDARRDREINASGDLVVRFTWTEIMDDAYRCAEIAVTMLRERVEDLERFGRAA